MQHKRELWRSQLAAKIIFQHSFLMSSHFIGSLAYERNLFFVYVFVLWKRIKDWKHCGKFPKGSRFKNEPWFFWCRLENFLPLSENMFASPDYCDKSFPPMRCPQHLLGNLLWTCNSWNPSVAFYGFKTYSGWGMPQNCSSCSSGWAQLYF